MHDLLIALAFIGMVVAPAVVAAKSGTSETPDAGSIFLKTIDISDCRKVHSIPESALSIAEPQAYCSTTAKLIVARQCEQTVS